MGVKLLLFAALPLLAAAQSSDVTYYTVPISVSALKAAGVPATGSDRLQVFISTTAADTRAFQATLVYSLDGDRMSATQTVSRLAEGYTPAVFAVKDVTAMSAVEIVIEELVTKSRQPAAERGCLN